jgi:hypothetical protein
VKSGQHLNGNPNGNPNPNPNANGSHYNTVRRHHPSIQIQQQQQQQHRQQQPPSQQPQQQQQQHPSMMQHTRVRLPNPINDRITPVTNVQNQGGQLHHINYHQQHTYRHPANTAIPQNTVKHPTSLTAPAPIALPQNPQNMHPGQHQHPQVGSITFDAATGKSMQTMWTCDICEVEDFQTFDEAVAHEKICQGGKNSKDSKINGNRSSNGTRSSPIRVASKAPPSQEILINPALSIHIPSPIKEEIPVGSVEPLRGSCYSCDICKRAYFRSFDEAIYHENLCEKNRDRQVALAAYQAANRKFIVEQSARKSHSEQILKNANTAVNTNPLLVISPLKKKRSAVPSAIEIVSKRPRDKASPEIIEIEDNDAEISDPEPEERVVAKVNTSLLSKKDNLPVSSLTNSKTGADCDRDFRTTMENLLELDFRVSKQKDEMLFTDMNLANVFKHLAPFFRSTFEKMCLTASSDNEDVYIPTGYRLVEIKCKYCSHKMRIKDLSKWGIALKTFAMFHLIEACLHAPNSLKANLKIQREMLKASDDTCLSLEKFCDCVAMCYDFLDANKIDSRIRSGVFIMLDENEKKRKVIGDDSPIRQKKINIVKPKMPEHDLMTASLTNQKLSLGELVSNSDDGTTNLTPFNGVPLLNSFSTRKCRSLRYCQKVLLSNLEIYQGDPIGSSAFGPIYLRCQNCNSGSTKWEKKLTGKRDFYKQTMLAHVHFKSCDSTSAEVQETISNVANTFSSSERNPMREYCRFLADVYGLQDSFCDKDLTVVIYSNSIYKIGDYSGKKIKLDLKSPVTEADLATESTCQVGGA